LPLFLGLPSFRRCPANPYPFPRGAYFPPSPAFSPPVGFPSSLAISFRFGPPNTGFVLSPLRGRPLPLPLPAAFFSPPPLPDLSPPLFGSFHESSSELGSELQVPCTVSAPPFFLRSPLQISSFFFKNGFFPFFFFFCLVGAEGTHSPEGRQARMPISSLIGFPHRKYSQAPFYEASFFSNFPRPLRLEKVAPFFRYRPQKSFFRESACSPEGKTGPRFAFPLTRHGASRL